MNQASDFAEALCQYVDEQLRYQDGEYILGAVRIIDARNHLFAAMLHQNTTGFCHSKFYCIHNFVYIHVSRNDLIVGTYNSDHRFFHFICSKSQSIK